MKQIVVLLGLGIILSSCGNFHSQEIGEDRTSETYKEVMQSENTEMLAEENSQAIAEIDMEITDEEEELLESLTGVKESFDPLCGDMMDAFFNEHAQENAYEVQTLYRKSETNHCIVAYYTLNDSGIHSYMFYDLEDDTILDEISCTPEYDVENDIMSYCDDEDLESLRLEYESMLEGNL